MFAAETGRMTLGIDKLKAELRAKLSGRQNVSLKDRRTAVDAIADFGAPGCDCPFEELNVAGVPTALFGAAEAKPDRGIIHLHGGAFVAGSARSHRYLAGTLAKLSGVAVYVPEYGLAPEQAYPTAVEQIVSVIRALASDLGGMNRLALSGDSAGSALMLAAVCRLRDEGAGVPAALAGISPFVDLGCRNETFEALASVDPFISKDGLMKDVDCYLGGADPNDPDVSPVFADLSGLPPLLIQIGSDEVLLGDARGLMTAAEAAGVKARLDVWAGMIHVWHLFPHFVSEADDALRDIAAFFNNELDP